jgi:hypothetical protein
VIVRQAASRCRAVPELCEAAAVEIANPQDRSRFLSEAHRVNASTAASESLPGPAARTDSRP